ncbi:unnamed protein product [Trichobilharzia szidati]|nr:unnamed protein product [Trichobilharzia szidati]
MTFKVIRIITSLLLSNHFLFGKGCEIQGTIDDNSAFEMKVPFGSRKPLKCGLLPYEAISDINGYWYAQTVAGSNDILSIRLENDEAVILPPVDRNLFDIPGVAEVECVFHDRNRHEKYFEFRKKLNVDLCDIQGSLNDQPELWLSIMNKSHTNTVHCGLLSPHLDGTFNKYLEGRIIWQSADVLYLNKSLNGVTFQVKNAGAALIECFLRDFRDHQYIFSYTGTIIYMTQQPIDVIYLEANYIPLYSNKILSFPLKKGGNLKWNVTFNNDSDLLSYSYELHCIIISPYGKYDKSGEVIFQTQQINENTGEFIRSGITKLIIYDTGRLGTLNGVDDLDVIVSVGSSETFKCGMIPKEDGGFWKAEIVGDKKDIVSLIYNNGNVYITPKRCEEAYVYIGQVQIQCSFSRDYRYAEFIFTKTLYIVDGDWDGTLNGKDTSDVVVGVGSSEKFKCGLLPHHFKIELMGYWEAEVVRGRSTLISIQKCYRQAVIGPPENSLNYTMKGYLQIQCILKRNTNNEVILKFKKAFEILDSMLGTLDGQSTEDVQIYVGSRPNLMCGLLPRNMESKLNGYWTARVVRGSKNYVNFESQNGSVFIKPSEKANFYSKPFDIEIECNYSKHRIGGKKIFTFTKSMKVKELYIILHPNVELRVGDQKTITCILPGDSTETLYSRGHLKCIPQKNSEKLISVDNSHNHPVIKPPIGFSTYPKSGHAFIECVFTFTDGRKTRTMLNIEIYNKSNVTYNYLMALMAFWLIVLHISCWTVYKLVLLCDLSNLLALRYDTEITHHLYCQDYHHHYQNNYILPMTSINNPTSVKSLPTNLISIISLRRKEFGDEEFTKLLHIAKMYKSYTRIVQHWRSLYDDNDREGLISSSELLIDFIRSSMKIDEYQKMQEE